ncbi:toll-like receptor 13 [Protopterus annectens]|uniref:toll-like receptor 13 n=1 Tax=Protopterus annectens TaxID=7888 RepID=UPI001CFBFFFB|nr:toll-like receptor 13 [Protopterus annectens]
MNKFFEKCGQLESLDISRMRLFDMEPGFLYTVPTLGRFIVLENALTTINICPTNNAVVAPLYHLDISRNKISTLESGQFSCMAYLRILNLAENSIRSIGESAFHGLGSLVELNLANNKLKIIETHYFDHLDEVSLLHLLENPIQRIDAGSFKMLVSLRDVSLSVVTWRYFHIDLWEFEPGIRILSLNTNGGAYINSSNAYHASTLQTLYLYGGSLASTFLFEDCESAPVTTVRELHAKRAVTQCFKMQNLSTFAAFTNLEKLYFQSRADWGEKLDLSKLENLKVLYLEDISKSIFAYPKESELLFMNKKSLESLILRNAGFSYFTHLMFQDLTNLKMIMIQRQTILSLDSQMFQNSVNLKYVFFSVVIFKCSCENAWIIRWAATSMTMSLNFHYDTCLDLYDRYPFVKFLDTCDQPIEFTIFALTTSFLLFFLVFSLLCKIDGWYVVYFFYIIQVWMLKLMGRRANKVHYKYDVFVSYSSKDELWVVTELLPNLEQKGPTFLKVCLHNRDFEAGKDIVDNIADSIYSSRKTICVITRHYLRSEWCSLEMRMATYRMLVESQDFLILLFLERTSPFEISAYHRLARMIKKKTYINWPEGQHEQQLFWVRLKDTIMKTKNDDQKPEI